MVPAQLYALENITVSIDCSQRALEAVRCNIDIDDKSPWDSIFLVASEALARSVGDLWELFEALNQEHGN